MEQDKVYHVIVSHNATEMLVACARFIANVSEEAANSFIDKFQEKANSLAELPERCSWLESPFLPKRKYRKYPFAGIYLLVYQIKNDTVYVDYVLDCRQDYQWLL